MVFGGVRALEAVTVGVPPGEIRGIIGPNGSGKSTLINVVSGYYVPRHGEIRLDGEVISGRSPEQIRAVGLVRTFQNLRLIDEMSVEDNALAGMYLSLTSRGREPLAIASSILGTPTSRKRSRAGRAAVGEALASVGLAHKARARVGGLSYGDQKRLELARAIAMRPRVLILDEPTAGMAVEEAEDLIRMIVALARTQTMSLLLVEHRLELVLEVCDRVTVMDGGSVVTEGDPAHIAADPDVRRIYVGGE